MGKRENKAEEGGDLWDDSALVDAFSQAMSKYKEMHGVGNSNGESEGKSGDGHGNGVALPSGNTDVNKEPEVHESQHDPMKESFTSYSDNIMNEVLKIQENQHGQEASTSEMVMEVPLRKEAGDVSADATGRKYGELLRQYHELEEKQQKVLEQLHQSGYWNNQSQFQGSTSIFGGSHYGYYNPSQQNQCWSTSLAQQEPAAHGKISGYYYNSNAQQNLCCSTSHVQQASAGNAKGKAEIGDTTESSEAWNFATDRDLSLVISSWYSAGYYTGRYATLQSLKKGDD